MRIWSVHPKYIDTKGLVALWRETLLAKKVLEGTTKGYKNHPQLIRFKNSKSPLLCINKYLDTIYQESLVRGYNFDINKFISSTEPVILNVSTGQLDYEMQHLLKKLKTRDAERYKQLLKVKNIEPHPLFEIVKGGIEDWEIV